MKKMAETRITGRVCVLKRLVKKGYSGIESCHKGVEKNDCNLADEMHVLVHHPGRGALIDFLLVGYSFSGSHQECLYKLMAGSSAVFTSCGWPKQLAST